MIGPRDGTTDVQVWLATAPVDMRKGFESLAEIVRSFLGHERFPRAPSTQFYKPCNT